MSNLPGMVEVTKGQFFEVVRSKDLSPSRSGIKDRNLSVWTFRGISGKVYGVTDYTKVLEVTHDSEDVTFHLLAELVKA